MRDNPHLENHLPLLIDRHTGRWLAAKPSGDTSLTNSEFLTSIRLRLGKDVYSAAGHDCPVCALDRTTKNHHITSNGASALKCISGNDRTKRHDELVDQLQHAISIPSVKEQKCGAGRKRAGDLFFPGAGKNGGGLAIDLGVVFSEISTKSIFIANTTLPAPSKAAAAYAAVKVDKHKLDVEATDINEFQAVCCSHFGAWTPTAKDTISRLAGRLSPSSLDSPALQSFRVAHVFDVMSVQLQKANARAIARRRGPSELSLARMIANARSPTMA